MFASSMLVFSFNPIWIKNIGRTFSTTLKTAIDFQEQGFNVHVVVDGSSSRSMVDRFEEILSFSEIEKPEPVILIL